ncbi:putative embigin [Scophthalmus maximus]|uniref:Putative embigin n=2 Tax=Scophthalmus maximus TaxID=52904 RepID=A0A2U9BTG9_SCOMX|nr:putative embigin [Scophthalmus maximus]
MSASWKQLPFQIFLLLVSCCRHTNTKTPPDPTPATLVPTSPLPTDVRSVVLKGESHTERVELLSPVDLALECTWTGGLSKPPNITGFWRKDGDEIENGRLAVQLVDEMYHLKHVFRIVSEENLGSYSCAFGNEARVDFILTAPQIGEVRDKPMVSYVGDSVVVACKMGETKPKPVSWNWYKANGTDREQISVAAEPRRYEFKNKEAAAKLVVHNLTEADSGLYYCEAVYAIGTTTSHVELRVITLWEPLKPFVAILVEVIILVAAILLFERSQSKKKCKGGNGANEDQTNTLTQGENSTAEESSSARHRKV